MIVYKHFKGNYYKYITTAMDCNNPKIKYIIYQGQDGRIWSREESDFFYRAVEVNNELVNRFTYMKTIPFKIWLLFLTYKLNY